MTFFSDFCIGGMSAGAVKSVMAPIERVKLLLQTQDANQMVLERREARFTGINNCFRRVYAEQGMLAFWRGNGANVIRYIPQQACNLAFKDWIKHAFPVRKEEGQFRLLLGNFTAAGVGASLSLSICYPLNFARTRLASDIGSGQRTFSSIRDCLSRTLRSQGVRGLYTGFASGIVNVILYRGTQIGCFDTIVEMLPYRKDKGINGVASSFVAAQTSGILAVFISYPPETLSRRMQMEAERPVAQRLYKSTLHCARHVWSCEGLQGFYKGALADVFRGFGAALVLVAYNRIKLHVDR